MNGREKSGSISNLTEDLNANIWFNTVEGLFKFSITSETFTFFPSNPGQRGVLEIAGQIADIAVNTEGQLVLGMFAHGIQVIDPDKQTITRTYDMVDGLPSLNVFTLKFSSTGDLWAGTSKGLGLLKEDKNQFLVYNRKDGLYPDYIDGGFEEFPDGKLLFRTSKGFHHFQPNDMFNSPEPQIAFTSIRLFEKEMELDNHIDYQETINLDYDQNFVTISFTDVSYQRSSKNRFAWQLSGVDHDWVYPSDNRTTASYANLAPGKYRFSVKASNHEGRWISKARQMEIVIKPPFWQTAWFRLLVAAAMISLIFGLFYWRIHVYKKEEKVRQQLADLELKALHAQINPHFIFNSLNSIKQLIQSDQKKGAITYLGRFSKMIREVLNISDKKLISIADELEIAELYLQLEKLRFEDKFDYQINIFSSKALDEVLIPPMVFQPFLENAIWHGIMHLEEKGNVLLRIEDHGAGLKCIIEDDGIGRMRSAQIKSKTALAHRSKGMQITKQRLRLQNKNCEIKVIDKSKGTRIEIYVP
ncbi:MAG: histidine kinase [Bacteroidota bacterium]